MATTKITRFTVRGTGCFPLDMLRYDNAWPDRQEDVTEIRNSLGELYEELRRLSDLPPVVTVDILTALELEVAR